MVERNSADDMALVFSQFSVLQRWLSDIERALLVSEIAVVALDQQLRVQHCTANIEQLIGVKATNLGRSIHDVFSSPGLSELLSFIEGFVIRGRRDATAILRINGKACRVTVSQDSERFDRFHRLIISIIDISREVANLDLSAGALRERAPELHFPGLVNNVPFAVGIHTGMNHTCIFANDEFRTWHPNGNPVGTTLEERCGKFPSEESRDLLDRAFQSGRAAVGQIVPFKLVSPDQEPQTRFFTGAVQPVRGKDGAIQGVMSVSLDVTDQTETVRRQERLILEIRCTLSDILAVEKGRAVHSEQRNQCDSDLLKAIQNTIAAIDNTTREALRFDPSALRVQSVAEQYLTQLQQFMSRGSSASGC